MPLRAYINATARRQNDHRVLEQIYNTSYMPYNIILWDILYDIEHYDAENFGPLCNNFPSLVRIGFHEEYNNINYIVYCIMYIVYII